MSITTKMFISSLIKGQSVNQMLSLGKMDHLFKEYELPQFTFVMDHVKKYGKFPSYETYYAHTKEDLPKVSEPAAYYRDILQEKWMQDLIKTGMSDAQKSMIVNPTSAAEALNILSNVVMNAHVQQNSQKLVNFKDAINRIIPWLNAKNMAGEDDAIKFGWPSLDSMAGGIGKGDLISFVGRPAMGKALAHGSLVLMRDGTFKKIEDVREGDFLASVDGGINTVLGVYPQGERNLVKLKFRDGRSVRCDHDHLWEVRRHGWAAPRVLTASQIEVLLQSSRNVGKLSIRLFSGEFGGATPIIDPYVLGALLGDGCLPRDSSYTLTSQDAFILDRVREGLPQNHDLVFQADAGKAKTYRLVSRGEANKIKHALKMLSLDGSGSLRKNIPAVAMTWSRSDRLALLQGLMDTDGWVQSGSALFGSSSLALASDVMTLVRSLGGKASLQSQHKTLNAPAYRVTVIMQDRREAFSLPRKAERLCGGTRHETGWMTITALEKDGTGLATCISVSHPSKLFICDNYVVTHNTWFLIWAMLTAFREQKKRPLFVSMEMTVAPIENRLASILFHIPVSNIMKAALSTKQKQKLKQGLTEIHVGDVDMYIVDGNLTSTVEDVWALASALNPDGIYIDGGYLMKHPNERDRFKRVAENCNLMKMELTPLAPTSVSWQFSRSGAKSKKKKGEKPELEDIGYTDAIGQDSSLVAALTQPDAVDTVIEREVDILKGRNGETGKFRTKWDFNKMDFSEIEQVPIHELQYS